MKKNIDTDLGAIIDRLPPKIGNAVMALLDNSELLEIVLDLGREPKARFLEGTVVVGSAEVTEDDLHYLMNKIGPFGDDNRAGIERTLHRISALRSRNRKIVGLTVRVGRAVYGTAGIVEDLVLSGKSVLLLGRPGVGKTTMLREIARVLADQDEKRVIVVDTSNEIAGDGDIPHIGIGNSRRMQVPSPVQQHDVMIEAVENHMPEVIVIDEIGTELEANASRTIAERGVQLVATAHGNALENLVSNPTLSDLIGGIDAVTLGDDEARRRKTQKTVLERRSSPTFDILIEIQGWNELIIHPDVAGVVDRMLRGYPIVAERRTIAGEGDIKRERVAIGSPASPKNKIGESNYFIENEPSGHRRSRDRMELSEEIAGTAGAILTTGIFPYGVNRGKLQQAIEVSGSAVDLVGDIGASDMVLTTKNFYRRKTKILSEAETQGKPVYVLRKNTSMQIHQFLRALARSNPMTRPEGKAAQAVREAEQGVARIIDGGENQAVLNPQAGYIRYLQHQLAEDRGLKSNSNGREPKRQVILYR